MTPPVPLIVNPAAGGGRAARQLDALEASLQAAGIATTRHATSGPGHATALATTLGAKHPTVFAAGGDGTGFEVINGLMALAPSERPKLGLIPLGTGNSFLRDVSVTDRQAAVACVARGRTRRVDVVLATHTTGTFYYLNLLAIGFTSDVGDLTNRRFKALGPAGYAVSTVIEVARLQHRVFPVSLDGQPQDDRPCVFLSFSNSRCTGGTMQMAPDARIDDGLLDVIRVGPLGRMELLSAFPTIYAGTHTAHPKIEATTARSATFDLAGALPLMVDGEILHHTLTRLDVIPGAIELLA